MSGALEGKVAVVTGGSSGMGRATAQLFAREGAAVVVADVAGDAGEETAAQIRATGQQASFVYTDTSNEAQVIELVAEAARLYSRVDAMVTAAGIHYANYLEGDTTTNPFIHPETGTILQKPTERWRRVLDVNLTGVMLCCREAARQMIAEGHGGTMVNFSSIAAYGSGTRLADYAVSKIGVVVLTKCLAAELGPSGIRVNAVAPGPIETAMTRVQIESGDLQRQGAGLPLRRTARPEEVASVVLFLSTDQSSYITGKTIGVDGGTNTNV